MANTLCLHNDHHEQKIVSSSLVRKEIYLQNNFQLI